MIGPLTPFSPFAGLHGRRRIIDTFTIAGLFANDENGVYFPITEHDGTFTIAGLFANDENGVYFPITEHDGGA